MPHETTLSSTKSAPKEPIAADLEIETALSNEALLAYTLLADARHVPVAGSVMGSPGA